MSLLTALKAEINSGVGCSLPLDCPDSAVSGAIELAGPFQKDQQKFATTMKDQSSAMVLGNSNCKIGLILSAFGRTPVEVMMCPSQGASNSHQWHSEALMEKSCCSNWQRTVFSVLTCCSNSVENIPTSSMHTSTSVKSENDSSIAACAHEGELRKPQEVTDICTCQTGLRQHTCLAIGCPTGRCEIAWTHPTL